VKHSDQVRVGLARGTVQLFVRLNETLEDSHIASEGASEDTLVVFDDRACKLALFGAQGRPVFRAENLEELVVANLRFLY